MRIVAVPRDENDVLVEDRARLSIWAPPNGWLYVEYADAFDLLSRLSEIRPPDQIAEIEIVAHGNPAICDDISLGNAAVVGESLRRIAGVSETTAVYLSGCNTGLVFNGECIAQTFADSYEARVFGSRGYIAGTHAEGNERCVASFALDGIVYHPYPGGGDASGNHAWARFGPPLDPNDGEQMQIKIATSGFRPVNLNGREGQELLARSKKLCAAHRRSRRECEWRLT